MPMTPVHPLIGRDGEIADLLGLVRAAEHGGGGALVLRGEPGIGKSALLAHVEHAIPETIRVIRATGSEFEAELPFAGLHQLCRPALDLLDTLTSPYRSSLEVAFGLAEGTPDPFRVGLAALELLATAAARGPLLCIVDDAQWLDSASSTALAFLARRIAAEPIAIVFATRDQTPLRGLDELPGIAVGGLSDPDARALLTRETSLAALDERVRDRFLAESRGNPLALIELPKSGGFSLPTPSPIVGRIERSFQMRMAALAPDARLLLILAGGEPTGDPVQVRAAARRLDIDVPTAVADAEASGLIMLDPRVRFCHPLARSAVYRAAEPAVRRRAHRALADTTDPESAPDRQAWHRAQAATGPDERVAAQLATSASRAQARGGVAASAAFLRRAAELSCDPRQRIERTLAAARATLETGEADEAAILLNGIDAGILDDPQHADLDLLRGQIAFVQGTDGVVRGPELIVQAARRLASIDPERSREVLVAALDMGLSVGRAAGVMDRVIDAARSAPATQQVDLLDALVRLSDDGHRAGIPAVRRALTGGEACWARTPALATVLAGELWDLDLHAEIVDWLVRTGRETGAPVIIRLGLAQAALHAVITGRFGQAMASIAEEEAIADAVGDLPQLYPRVHVAAMRGRRHEVLDLFTEGTSRDTGLLTANLSWAKAVLHNGLGDYPAALEAAQRAVASGDLFLAGFALPELVESAVRCGEAALARSALDSLLERTEAAGTDFALGVAAGARALVTDEEDQYRAALEHLSGRSVPLHLARAHLRYGEWLRRAGRRRDAREHLCIAYDRMAEMGSEAFAQRAETELRATGEVARRRTEHTYDHLTMQEMHIARQVATGATTKEVATRLFLSPRTVDAHLRNIFRKLEITSRRQLRTMPDLE
ncbi:MAG: AAA family ATPase [Brachybacterium sp.]|uniref:ATP-binding protein n=1 Tax=Brachybacterium sp. TaxID=1891286 RepID=UPI002648FC6B|nr:AAA family ATPase [Brachybacterium sp.]MDN5685209.1 AAA family ATPase [Brachybacterium sp.]